MGSPTSLFTIKVEDFPILNITFQVVVYSHRCTTGRATCVDYVARLQREVPTDVADNLVYLIKHIARAAFLHGLTVDVKMEMNTLNV